MSQIAGTVNNLQSQLSAIQAAIEGNSQASMFKPTPITGALSDDVNEWLAKFERFAKFYNWSSTKKLGAMVLLFEGPALSWFHTLPEETSNSFTRLVGALRNRFSASNNNLILRQALYAKKQGSSESLTNYTADIIKRCQRLSLNDAELMNIFINGLKPELRSHLVLNQPTSFTEAEKLARLREAVTGTSEVNSVTVSNPTVHEQRIKELEGQVKLLLSLASNQTSSKAPSLNSTTSDVPRNLLHDVPSPLENQGDYLAMGSRSEIHQVKADIIAAIQNSTQNNVRPSQNRFQPN